VQASRRYRRPNLGTEAAEDAVREAVVDREAVREEEEEAL